MKVTSLQLAGMDHPLVLHPRLTVVADVAGPAQIDLVGRIATALTGNGDGTASWIDSVGEPCVSGSGEEPGPRLTLVRAEDLAIDPSPQRLLTLLGRARETDRRGLEALAVLMDPFAPLPIMRIWELLSLTERVSERVQTLLVTDDEVTVAWSAHRAGTGQLDLVRFWAPST